LSAAAGTLVCCCATKGFAGVELQLKKNGASARKKARRAILDILRSVVAALAEVKAVLYSALLFAPLGASGDGSNGR